MSDVGQDAPRAWARLADELTHAARLTVYGSVKQGARLIVEEPWRLDGIVGGAAPGTSDHAQHVVRYRKDLMRDLGRRNPSFYDANRMLALRQAYVAIRILRWRERSASIRKAPA